jgi:hypothetical protein
MSEEFTDKLTALAKRSVGLADRCTNEESTKMFLVLPFINFLGYDDRNPLEVCPEHAADFSDKYKNRVDFAILQNDEPIIAIECKACNTLLKDERGQLRSYFNAAPTVKMGILTDGLIFEFYADSDEPNMMDNNAFLTVNLRDIASGRLEDSVIDGLTNLQKGKFNAENIGAEAKRKLAFQKILQEITSLAEKPSDGFTRMLLKTIGIQHVRDKSLPEYQEMVGAAFREFVNLKILQRLALTKEAPVALAQAEISSVVQDVKADCSSVITTETELEVFAFIKQRLAFLVKDEALFNAIQRIQFADYKGKFVVFYDRERRGRLFDFYEGGTRGPKYRFSFADATEDLTTSKLAGSVIDEPLLRVFKKKVNGDANAVA